MQVLGRAACPLSTPTGTRPGQVHSLPVHAGSKAPARPGPRRGADKALQLVDVLVALLLTPWRPPLPPADFPAPGAPGSRLLSAKGSGSSTKHTDAASTRPGPGLLLCPGTLDQGHPTRPAPEQVGTAAPAPWWLGDPAPHAA